MRLLFLVAIGWIVFSLPVSAHKDDMTRIFSCKGADTLMEVYLNDKIVFADDWKRRLKRGARGFYALDISEVGKGKHLEPVNVKMSKDGRTISVDQFARGLPPTRIPMAGGTVDFDQRFGTGAKCKSYRWSPFQ